MRISKVTKKSKKLTFLMAVTIIVIVLISNIVAVLTSYRTFTNMSDDIYKETANNVADTVVSLVDGDIIGDYALTRDQDDEYWDIYNTLCAIQSSNKVKYLYIQKVIDEQAISIVDTDQVNPMAFREVFPISEGSDSSNLDVGVPAFMNYAEGQWLVTVFKPIKDSQGVTQAFVGVDISVDEMVRSRQRFLVLLVALLVIIAVFMAAVSIYATDRTIVKPIGLLSNAAKNFVSKGDVETGNSIELEQIQINSANEINDLHAAIVKMEQDIYAYIDNITAVTAEKERIGAELNIAKDIQASSLPTIFPPFPDCKEFDLFASMDPAKEVGGDFYDFFMIDKTHLGLVMADVSGKGVPAALFMMISKTLIKNQCQTSLSPAEVLERVNNQLCENNSAEMFVTVWLGILDITTGVLTAANGGHEYPAIKRTDGKFELYKDPHGFVLAGMEGVEYKKKEYEIVLTPGDKLFVYTDGVAEATDINNELFGTDRMLGALNKDSNASVHELLSNVRGDIDAFVKEAPQFDDITMLSLVYYGQE